MLSGVLPWSHGKSYGGWCRNHPGPLPGSVPPVSLWESSGLASSFEPFSNTWILAEGSQRPSVTWLGGGCGPLLWFFLRVSSLWVAA